MKTFIATYLIAEVFLYFQREDLKINAFTLVSHNNYNNNNKDCDTFISLE